jgi:hypothetical protein
MNERCQHSNEASQCCQCLTEKFKVWEANQQRRREEAQLVRQSICTYRSKSLGMVTIPAR